MRRREGEETWHRILEWDRGHAASERLAATLLFSSGFQNVDPSHPLGGKDGLKDMVLSYQGQKWIGAVYFPRGQQDFTTIKQKVAHDIEGVKKNHAHGLAFVINQELRLSERTILSEINPELAVKFGEFDMLLTGDVEGEGEEQLTRQLEEQYRNCTWEILKVAHHGSKNSSTEEFLRQIKPVYAFISAGQENRYGHPHQETIERLADIGSKIYSTQENGAIIVEVEDGETMKVGK